MSKRTLHPDRRAASASATPQVAGRLTRQSAFAAVLLVAAVFLLYVRTTGFPLIYTDDDLYLLNPYTQQGLSWSSVRWAFSLSTPLYWHPLAWLSHMLDTDIFGAGVTGGPHTVNFLLHAANSLLVLALLKRLTGKFAPSAAVALLFAVHPLRVESVVWLAERKDVLCGFFSLLTIWAYAVYATRPFHWARYAAVFMACACAMMSKPMAVTLPFVLLLLDWWPLERFQPLRSRIAEKLPLLALSALTIWNVLRSSPAEVAGAMSGITIKDTASVGVRMSNALFAYVQSLWATFWPHPLALVYPFATDLSLTTAVLSSLLLLAVTVIAFQQRHRRPYCMVGWLWFLGMLVPVIGIVPRGMDSHADRFTYLPHVGLLMAVVWLAWDFVEQRPRLLRKAAWGVAFVAAALASVSWARIHDWSDAFSFYEHDLQVTGKNPKLRLQYGQLLLNAGDAARASQAEAQFRAVLAQFPQADAPRYGLGNALLVQKHYAEAATVFAEVLRMEPTLSGAHMGLAMAQMNLGKKEDARGHFSEALRLGLPSAQTAQAHNNLGVILMQQGNVEDALGQFQSAAGLEFRLLSARRNIAAALLQLNRRAEAKAYIEETIQSLGPDPVLVQLRDSLQRFRDAK